MKNEQKINKRSGFELNEENQKHKSSTNKFQETNQRRKSNKQITSQKINSKQTNTRPDKFKETSLRQTKNINPAHPRVSVRNARFGARLVAVGCSVFTVLILLYHIQLDEEIQLFSPRVLISIVTFVKRLGKLTSNKSFGTSMSAYLFQNL